MAHPTPTPKPHPTPTPNPHPSPKPSSWDWTTQGAVTPVKNQIKCGAGWAFAATGAIEGLQFIHHKVLTSLSEQQLLDCVGSGATCTAGSFTKAFQWTVYNKGLCTEGSYPYTGVKATCQKSCTPVTQISSFTQVTPNNDTALAAAILRQPVAVNLEADQEAFQFYSSGVLTGTCGSNVNFAGLAVGFGTDAGTEYFKVKNSWGASWGESGYVLIARGESYNGGYGQCGIYVTPAFPNGH